MCAVRLCDPWSIWGTTCGPLHWQDWTLVLALGAAARVAQQAGTTRSTLAWHNMRFLVGLYLSPSWV